MIDDKPTLREEKNIYQIFRLSILLKGAISAAEIVAGILLLLIPLPALVDWGFEVGSFLLPQTMLTFFRTHTDALLLELAVLPAPYIALYIGSRGLIKLVLIIALLKNQLWAYPSSLAVLGLFLLYQFYQIATTFSGIIIAVSIFDIVVMYFIWREWRIVVAHAQKMHTHNTGTA